MNWTVEQKREVLRARAAMKAAIHNCSFSWLFCHDCSDKHQPDDCACIITWADELTHCDCICHERTRELDGLIAQYYHAIRNEDF